VTAPPRGGRDLLYRLCLIFVLLLGLSEAQAAPCDPASPCPVATGAYVLRAPAGWDGRSALPLVMFFHGFGSSPQQDLAETDLGSLADARNVLLVLPIGLDRRWNVRPGGPRPRDDIAYAHEVLADVLKRFPIDRRTVVASGFSAGAFITWNVACYAPEGFTGFLPVAGAFWEPVPEGPCPGGPVNLRHVHGLTDETVPMRGRVVGSGAKQGDIRASLAAMIRTNRCEAMPVATPASPGEACTTWRGCASGRTLTFCSHGGGHDMRAAFLEEGLDWLAGLERSSER
jgi:polyhydroxybutyrate depolymerase